MSTFSKFWNKYGSWCYSSEAGVAEIAETAIKFAENELLRRIEVLELRENDIIILSYDGILSEAVCEKLKSLIRTIADNKVMILEDGMTLSALRFDITKEDGSDF